MSGPTKVYVIDPVKPSSNGKAGKSSGGNPSDGLPEYLRGSGSGGGSSSGGDTTSRRNDDKKSGVPLILSYVAGPLAVFATRRGRKSRFWSYMSLISVATSLIVIWMWRGLHYWSTPENPVGAVMLIASVLAAVSGFSAWARAVDLAGRYEGPRIRRSPEWVRGSWSAGITGIFFPGMGLFLAGRHKQAIAALWMACLTLVSILVLSRSIWIWEFNAHAGAFAIEPDTLERVFLIFSAAAVLGGLAWIAQALNGARLAGRASNRKAVSRSNWAAVALLISLAAFSFFSRPAEVAEVLDQAAASAAGLDMKIIPLYMSRIAMRLDPSQPRYFVRTIGLLENSGDNEAAGAMRRRLVASLGPSLPLLEEEGLVTVRSRTRTEAIVPALPDIQEHAAPAPAVIPAELRILNWEFGDIGL